MEGIDILIEEYNKNPVNNFKMEDPTLVRHEGNFICGDDLTVYLKLDWDIIQQMSFDGNPSNITIAAASLLCELVEWVSIEEVITWDYQTMIDNGFEVSPKRKRAAVITLLAIRNAYHQRKNQKEEWTDKILEEDFDSFFDD